MSASGSLFGLYVMEIGMMMNEWVGNHELWVIEWISIATTHSWLVAAELQFIWLVAATLMHFVCRCMLCIYSRMGKVKEVATMRRLCVDEQERRLCLPAGDQKCSIQHTIRWRQAIKSPTLTSCLTLTFFVLWPLSIIAESQPAPSSFRKVTLAMYHNMKKLFQTIHSFRTSLF